ncbi:hypothetical protein JOE65_002670 [Arthrobacter roseus]|nr:hypothetical protein [Arthrobacter roseus]
MRSDSGHLISPGNEVSDKFCRSSFPTAENILEKFVRQALRVAEALDGVFG